MRAWSKLRQPPEQRHGLLEYLALLCLIAAATSMMRGGNYRHAEELRSEAVPATP